MRERAASKRGSRVALTLVAAAAVGFGVWWVAIRSEPAAPGAVPDVGSGVRAGPDAGLGEGAGIDAHQEVGLDADVRAEREAVACEHVGPLDCAAPRGAAAVMQGGAVARSALCAAVAARVGAGAEVGAGSAGAGILDGMIDALLVEVALAERGKEVSSADVDAELARLKVIVDGLDAATVSAVRAQLAARIAMERLVAELGDTEPSGEEVKAVFEEAPERFGVRAAVGAEAYLARPAGDGAKRRVMAWKVALEGGADGAKPVEGVARLGAVVFAQDGLEPELEALVWAPGAVAADGVWLGPVATKSGWLVLRVTERKEPQRPRLDDVYERVRVAASERLRVSEGARIVAELRGKSAVQRCVTF